MTPNNSVFIQYVYSYSYYSILYNLDVFSMLKYCYSKVLSADSLLSTQDQANLHEAISTGKLSTIATAMASVDSLRHNFKENVLHELEQDCKNICLKGEPSELRKNKFGDMAEFEWQKLSSEMSNRCPFLLDVLLRVMDKSKEELSQIIPRLGLCYAILMQTRNRELSLVQRLNTVLFTHGNAKKEVGKNTTYAYYVLVMSGFHFSVKSIRKMKHFVVANSFPDIVCIFDGSAGSSCLVFSVQRSHFNRWDISTQCGQPLFPPKSCLCEHVLQSFI